MEYESQQCADASGYTRLVVYCRSEVARSPGELPVILHRASPDKTMPTKPCFFNVYLNKTFLNKS